MTSLQTLFGAGLLLYSNNNYNSTQNKITSLCQLRVGLEQDGFQGKIITYAPFSCLPLSPSNAHITLHVH